MTSIRIYGNTSGYIELAAPDIGNNTIINLPGIANNIDLVSVDPSGNIVFSNSSYTTISFPPAINNIKIGIPVLSSNVGYSYLPNGILMQWGRTAANSTVGSIQFPIPFPTIVYNIQVTGIAGAANAAYVSGFPNTSWAVIRTPAGTGAQAANNAVWFAIGS